jgi:hypothetical protein
VREGSRVSDPSDVKRKGRVERKVVSESVAQRRPSGLGDPRTNSEGDGVKTVGDRPGPEVKGEG